MKNQLNSSSLYYVLPANQKTVMHPDMHHRFFIPVKYYQISAHIPRLLFHIPRQWNHGFHAYSTELDYTVSPLYS